MWLSVPHHGTPDRQDATMPEPAKGTQAVERAAPLFWLYAARHDRWDELVRLASPTLEQLGEDTRETVNLAVAQGDRVVQVGQVDSQYMLGTRDWTQIDVPPHASALGKVLYAYAALPVPRGRLQPLTPQTVVDS